MRLIAIGLALLLAACGEDLPKEPCEYRKITGYSQSDFGSWHGPWSLEMCVVKSEAISTPFIQGQP